MLFGWGSEVCECIAIMDLNRSMIAIEMPTRFLNENEVTVDVDACMTDTDIDNLTNGCLLLDWVRCYVNS